MSKVAAGAAESLPFATVANLGRVLGWLKDYGVAVFGTSDRGNKSLFDAELDRPLALVMGSEGDGIRRLTRDTCDQLVRLPMAGQVESLNVSVTAALCLRELTGRLRAGDGWQLTAQEQDDLRLTWPSTQRYTEAQVLDLLAHIECPVLNIYSDPPSGIVPVRASRTNRPSNAWRIRLRE